MMKKMIKTVKGNGVSVCPSFGMTVGGAVQGKVVPPSTGVQTRLTTLHLHQEYMYVCVYV